MQNVLRLWCLGLCLLVMIPSVRADSSTLGVEQVIALKASGFSDAQIIAWLKTKQSQLPSLNDVDLQRLKEAGVSQNVVDFLRTKKPVKKVAPSKSLSLKGVLAYVRSQSNDATILDFLSKHNKAFKLSPGQIVGLQQSKVSLAVILGVQKLPLNFLTLKMLLQRNTKQLVLKKLLGYIGFQRKLSLRQAAKLRNLGATEAILQGLIEHKPKPKPTVKPQPTLTSQTTKLVNTWKVFRHVGRQFELQIPSSWKVHQAIVDAEPRYAFTPEPNSSFKNFQFGMRLRYRYIGRHSPLQGRSLHQLYGLFRPELLAQNPTMKPLAGPKPANLGRDNIQGLQWVWQSTGAQKEDQARLWVFLVKQDNKVFVITFRSLKSSFAELSGTYRKILSKMVFREEYSSRFGKKLDAQKTVAKFQKSVVQVRSGYLVTRNGRKVVKYVATGTGFIVREDGYLITNQHVVWNSRAKKPFTHFLILWDRHLQQRNPRQFTPVTAKLLSLKLARGKSSLLRGVDIALMKLNSNIRHTAMPLTLSHNVKLGDPCITMGFPRTDLVTRKILYGLFLFVTRGVVVRFNRNKFGEVESLFTDARIDHGNSGGPCVNLATGGVMGLNTFYLRNMRGYFGVISSDAVIREYPQYFHLPAFHRQSFRFHDYYQLAYDYYHRKRWKALNYVLKLAFSGNSHYPEANYLKARSLYVRGKVKESIALLSNNLLTFPNHYATLLFLAQVYTKQKRNIRAIASLDRAIAAFPKRVKPYLMRAELYLRIRKYSDARFDAQKASKLSYNRWSQPFLLLAKVYAREGNKEKSMENFRKALQVSPGDFLSRMRLGKEYEKRRMFEAAILEYRRIDRSSPNQGKVQESIGHCYMALKNYQDAQLAYERSLSAHERYSTRPGHRLYVNLANIHVKVRKDNGKAIKVFIKYLNSYGKLGSAAYRAHLALSRLFHRSSYSSGLAFAHLQTAKSLQPKSKAIAALSLDVIPNPIRLRDIAIMFRMNYRPNVIIQLLRSSYVRKADFRGWRMRYTMRRALMYYMANKQQKLAILRALKRASKTWTSKIQYARLFTGSKTGTYYKVGRSLQTFYKKNSPRSRLVVVTSQGSTRNIINLLRSGAKGFAFVQFDVLNNLRKNRYLRRKVNRYLRLVSPMFTEEIHILIRKGSKIRYLSQLKGKRVNVGGFYSGTRVSFNVLAKAAGFKRKDLKISMLQPKAALQKLLNKELDAMVYTVAAPARLFSQLPAGTSREVELLSLSKYTIKRLLRKMPKFGYKATSIKGRLYSWQKKAVNTIAVPGYLITNVSEKNGKVKQMLETIYENLKALKKVHAKWGDLKLINLHKAYKGSLKKLYHSAVRSFLRENRPKGMPAPKLNMVTGHKTGTYFPMAHALQKVLKKKKSTLVRLNIKTSSGSSYNLYRVSYGSADVGWSQMDLFQDRINSSYFRKKYMKTVRVLTPTHYEELHLVVRRGSSIKSYSDLKRKRVNVGSFSSGTQTTVRKVLSGLGISYYRLKRRYSSPKYGLSLLLKGKIDATFFTTGAPTKLFKNLSTLQAKKLRLIPLTKNEAAKLVKKYRKFGYQTTFLQKKVYPWLNEDVRTIAVPSLLLAHKSLSEKEAREIVRMIATNKKELTKLHPKWGEFSVRALRRSLRRYKAYYHPGVKDIAKRLKLEPIVKLPTNTQKGNKTHSKKIQLQMTTGSTQGTYSKMSQALAKVLKESNSLLNITVMPSVGSVQNILSLNTQKVDLALIQRDVLGYWFRRSSLRRQLRRNVRLVAPTHREEIHIFVRKGSKIRTIADLKGKRVALGQRRSGTAVSALTLLQSLRIKLRHVKFTWDSPKTGIKKLLSGKLDAAFYTIGAPAKILQALPDSVVSKLTLLSVSKAEAKKMFRKLPKFGYKVTTIKKGTYPWLTTNTEVFSVPCILLSKRTTSVKVISELLKLMFGKRKQLAELHPKWSELSVKTLEASYKSNKIYYHPVVGKLLPLLKKNPSLILKKPKGKKKFKARFSAPTWGPKSAPILLEVWSDFQCPFCVRLSRTVNKLKKAYGKKLRIVFHHYPLSFHRQAHIAAQASMAAHEQGKFWKYHDILFKNYRNLKISALLRYAKQAGLNSEAVSYALSTYRYKRYVNQDMQAGKKRSVRATPTSFINGKKFIGAQPFYKFKEKFDAILKEKGKLKPVLRRKPPIRRKVTSKFKPVFKAPSWGPKTAPIVHKVYSNFQCPFCARLAKTIAQLKKDYGKKVRIEFHHYPLGFHKYAHLAAQASMAAHEQGKFWQYHDILVKNYRRLERRNLIKYANKVELDVTSFRAALSSGRYKGYVDDDKRRGKKLGVRGTPNSFVNGEVIRGAHPYKRFKVAYDKILAKLKPVKRPVKRPSTRPNKRVVAKPVPARRKAPAPRRAIKLKVPPVRREAPKARTKPKARKEPAPRKATKRNKVPTRLVKPKAIKKPKAAPKKRGMMVPARIAPPPTRAKPTDKVKGKAKKVVQPRNKPKNRPTTRPTK